MTSFGRSGNQKTEEHQQLETRRVAETLKLDNAPRRNQHAQKRGHPRPAPPPRWPTSQATLPTRQTRAPCQKPNAYPAASSTGSAGMTAESCWSTTMPDADDGSKRPQTRCLTAARDRPPARCVEQGRARAWRAETSTIAAPSSTSTPTTRHATATSALPRSRLAGACLCRAMVHVVRAVRRADSGRTCEPLPRPCEPTRLPPGRLPLSPSFARPGLRVSWPGSPTSGAAAVSAR